MAADATTLRAVDENFIVLDSTMHGKEDGEEGPQLTCTGEQLVDFRPDNLARVRGVEHARLLLEKQGVAMCKAEVCRLKALSFELIDKM